MFFFPSPGFRSLRSDIPLTMEGLRLCHSLLLAAGALTKIMKLTALQLFVLFPLSGISFASLRHPSPPAAGRCKANKKISVQASLTLIFHSLCGEGGIRTPGTSPFNGFQDRRNRPLCHLSSPCKTLLCFVWDCKGR